MADLEDGEIIEEDTRRDEREIDFGGNTSDIEDADGEEKVISLDQVTSRKSTVNPSRPRVEAWTPETLMSFGKYKGQAISEVPVHYLRWLAGYTWSEERRTFVRKTQEKESFYGRLAHEYFSKHNRCVYCAKPLVAIGDARANGAKHSDWDGRVLHKQCWEKAMKREEYASRDRSDGGYRGSGGGGYNKQRSHSFGSFMRGAWY